MSKYNRDHYCKSYEVVKDEGHAKILLCPVCGREYRKFWNEDLTQMHVLNEVYIHDKEMIEYNKKLTITI